MKREKVLSVLNCAIYGFIGLEVLGCILQFIDDRLIGPQFVVLMFCFAIFTMFIKAFVNLIWKFKDLYNMDFDIHFTMEEYDPYYEYVVSENDIKEIHFYKDVSYTINPNEVYTTHNGTKRAIDNNVKCIHTTSLSNISFDLLDKNYRIFLHENGRTLECKPGMDGTEKDVRKAHNIFRMINAGVFDSYFYNENETDEYVDDERCVESKQEAGENNNDTNE